MIIVFHLPTLPLLLLQLLILVKISQSCPDACQPCLPELISCQRGGLSHLPSQLDPDTRKILLSNQIFSSQVLTPANFSQFTKPQYSIEQLSIRRSNIHLIQSQTFQVLKSLDYLDLSDNSQLHFQAHALDQLKLRLLKLDSIGNLTLDNNAFSGLMVSSLSIKSSNLRSISYSIFEPISKHLRQLYLSDNHLSFIAKEFESLFRQLQVLHIYNNPLVCSCPMLWLAQTLLWRRNYYRQQLTIDSSSSSAANQQYLRCHSPEYLANQPLLSLSRAHFNCDPPRLEKIQVKFSNNPQTAQLTCVASVVPVQAHLVVTWSHRNSSVPKPRLVLTSSARNEAVVTINRLKQFNEDRLLCQASSSSGNTSIKVNINWPAPSTNHLPPDFLYPTEHTSHNFQPRLFTDNIFFKEQYTLLELLGSVLGTFLVTLVVFVSIYKFYFYRSVRLKKQQMQKKSGVATGGGYATYEVGLYSDSQTYDVPQYSTNHSNSNNTTLNHQHHHHNSGYTNNNNNNHSAIANLDARNKFALQTPSSQSSVAYHHPTLFRDTNTHHLIINR